MPSLITLDTAAGADWTWARQVAARRHYLRKAVDPRSRPLAYVVRLAGERVGCLTFGRTQSTTCFEGELTYGSKADVTSGRARYDRWEILNLARAWLSPDVQQGGALHRPGWVPGFMDRKGTFRSSLASAVLGAALARVAADYLLVYPPCFLDEPWAIRVVLSYCDTRLHKGTVYRAAGFRLSRRNDDGVETWFTTAVAGLSAEQDEAVRRAARRSPRGQRLRAARQPAATLWEYGGG